MSGSVSIARSIFDHAVFADEAKTEREAWIWLIMEASWKSRVKRVGNVVAATERGQLAASVRFLASAWKWTAPKVQRYLKRLEKMEMIRSDADTGVTIITICNYDEYQPSGKASDTASIQRRYSGDTNENKGEIREEGKKDANASARSTAPSPDVSRFQEFWDAYPHRGGTKRNRSGAEDKYRAAIKAGASQQEIIDGAGRAHTDQRVRDGYARDPTTWLNQQGWKDEIQPQPNFTVINGSAHDRQSPQQNRQAAASDAQRRIYEAAIRNRAPSGANIEFG
ncbi:hypothetical protein PE067_09270 [Paracoccus sp. DMF-8]|uniref:hypothetical protein n=1 Tax=Paracoccus sp. DMF-8 TaxID=3019445 RepID=UPI0023E846AF|nr:hypothetical protein [Paracoccus sp. DMF-8]MDF3606308.1 hypothetical protein [Paracoccus sp. DMF-8]